MRKLWLTVMLFTFASAPFAQDDQIERMRMNKMETFTFENLKWADEPILPKGAQSALVVGDPNKAGVFIAYLKFPPNYPIPAHTHPFAEVITVLKGKLGNGMGKKFDKSNGEVLGVGASFTLPQGHTHYVWTTDEETIVQLIATGPWGITYTNPKDDPRNNR